MTFSLLSLISFCRPHFVVWFSWPSRVWQSRSSSFLGKKELKEQEWKDCIIFVSDQRWCHIHVSGHSNCLGFRLTMLLAASHLVSSNIQPFIVFVSQDWSCKPKWVHLGIVVRMCCCKQYARWGEAWASRSVLSHLSISINVLSAYLWSLRLLMYASDLNSSCWLQICPVECMGKMLHGSCIVFYLVPASCGKSHASRINSLCDAKFQIGEFRGNLRGPPQEIRPY